MTAAEQEALSTLHQELELIEAETFEIMDPAEDLDQALMSCSTTVSTTSTCSCS